MRNRNSDGGFHFDPHFLTILIINNIRILILSLRISGDPTRHRPNLSRARLLQEERGRGKGGAGSSEDDDEEGEEENVDGDNEDDQDDQDDMTMKKKNLRYLSFGFQEKLFNVMKAYSVHDREVG